MTPADIGAVNKAGDTMTGKLAVMQGDGLSTGGGQISAKPTGGANGQRGTISLYSTFENSTDKGVRRTADIVAGFDGGVWGTEFLAFHVGNNGAANDAQNLTVEIARLTKNGMTINGNTVWHQQKVVLRFSVNLQVH